METELKEIRTEKKVLEEELGLIGAWVIKYIHDMPEGELQALQSQRIKILRRLAWLNTEIWLLENAQPANRVR